MTNTGYKSPLHEMASTTKTDFWNDSCSIAELKYALEYGAVGATTNPVIVGNVLKAEMPLYEDRIKEMVGKMSNATEDEIAWELNEQMALDGAKLLLAIYEASKGQKGRISIQTNTKYYKNSELLLKQSIHFNKLSPNIQVKIPVTEAGIKAIEDATYEGVSINGTVSFTVSQALAVADAVERGLKRREAEGKDISFMHPVCTLMVGRVDDWLKFVVEREGLIVEPECLNWAGVAVMKKAYQIYQKRAYRTQLLAAAYRNHYQWTEFMGADMSLTISNKWMKRFNNSDIVVENRIDKPVDPRMMEVLSEKVPEFDKFYEEEGMTIEEFDYFGPVKKTLIQFLEGYDSLLSIIRKYMIE